ncbi:Protein SDS23, partial [Cryomyces minteri]
MSNGDFNPLSPTTKGSLHLKANTSPTISHRPSFAENLRGVPPSPRSQRQPSLSQQALQELMNNPPVANSGDRRFVGKDWRQVKVGEIVAPEEVRFVEAGTSVEDATNLLISSGAPNVVLIRDTADSRTAVGTFDYSDLNAYLLLVVGLAHPDEGHISSFKELAKKGREGKTIVLSDVKDLGRKEPLLVLPNTEGLSKAVEIFGSGTHRIIIVEEGTTDVVGILTQLRL